MEVNLRTGDAPQALSMAQSQANLSESLHVYGLSEAILCTSGNSADVTAVNTSFPIYER